MRTILVCSGTELLGDGVMKLPFLRAVRRTWPDAHVTWLAMSGSSVFATTLAELVRPYIDEVIEHGGVGARWWEVLDRPLQGRRFDLVLDTQRRVRTTAILRRIPHGTFVSGAAGFLLSNRRPWPPVLKERNMVRAMLRLVLAAGGTAGCTAGTDHAVQVPERFALAAAAALPGADRGRHVGFAPGAGGRHKCWPLDRFVAAARAVAADGWRPVFLLGPAEAEMAGAVRAGCPEAALPLSGSLSGDAHDAGADPGLRASPLFTVACARHLRAAVANDSGVGHLLAAADVPLLSLFGPTRPAKFAPLVTRGTVLKAQDFGGGGTEAIPLQAVLDGLGRLLA